MGRGNICTFGEYEGLYYVDWDNFTVFKQDEDGNETDEPDYDLQRELMEEALMVIFPESFMKRFPSFTRCDKWNYRPMEKRVIMENRLYYICIADNEWSMAVMLIQKEDCWGDSGMVGLQKKHFHEYMDGLREVLFYQFSELGTYAGAWTSGRIARSA